MYLPATTSIFDFFVKFANFFVAEATKFVAGHKFRPQNWAPSLATSLREVGPGSAVATTTDPVSSSAAYQFDVLSKVNLRVKVNGGKSGVKKRT
jgi:hypothetical protein